MKEGSLSSSSMNGASSTLSQRSPRRSVSRTFIVVASYHDDSQRLVDRRNLYSIVTRENRCADSGDVASAQKTDFEFGHKEIAATKRRRMHKKETDYRELRLLFRLSLVPFVPL